MIVTPIVTPPWIALTAAAVVLGVVAIANGLHHLFVQWLDGEGFVLDASDEGIHRFYAQHPSHCDACWREAGRRLALKQRAERRAGEGTAAR